MPTIKLDSVIGLIRVGYQITVLVMVLAQGFESMIHQIDMQMLYLQI